jgi:hypothetical protein
MSVTISGSGQIVKQVVQAVGTSQVTLTSTSYTSILSASITPTNSANKILVMVSAPLYVQSTGNAYTTIYRNNTTDIIGNSLGRGFCQTAVVGSWTVPVNITYLDSPATTSATSYQIYAKVGGGTSYFGNDGTGQSITLTLMEIAYA